jgi:periplasmic protein TonB
MNTGEKDTPIPAFGQIGRETWLTSLRAQLRQLSEERRQPPAKLELTSKLDPAALGKLVDTESSFVSLIRQVRTTIGERRHPPERVETTAAPVEVPELWSPHEGRSASLASLGIHVLVALLLIFPLFTGTSELPEITETFIPLYLDAPLVIELPAQEEQSGGGGGGGLQEETPPSEGELPRAAEEQFVPPTPVAPNNDPILVVEPTIVAPQLATLQPLKNLALLGLPDGIPGPPSAGPGLGGGIGTGQGRGVGEGEGPGFGEGEGGGTGGGVFTLGGGVTPPTVVYRVDPEYSEDARRARHQGTVVLEAIVRRDGSVEILGVAKGLGYGLDENAIAALNQWKFNPGKKDGQAVDVRLSIEVNFTLR